MSEPTSATGGPSGAEGASGAQGATTARPLLPRLLLGIFALGSVTIVASVAILSNRDWQEFVGAARTELARYPVIEAELGAIERIEVDVAASKATGGENTLVLDLTGARASGTVIAEVLTVTETLVLRIDGNLVLSDGIVHPMVPIDAEPPPTESPLPE